MAIQAMIFDLDGTLLQTERLKAVSYAPAKMRVIAVSTPITREQLHDSGLIEVRWIIDDPALLPEMIQRRIDSIW